MNYDEIKNIALQLTYRDKLRLAQLLLQCGRKEEEEQYVEIVKDEKNIDFSYILERVLKSRPGKLKSLQNYIASMFQFRGSISDEDIKTLISRLEKTKAIKIDGNTIIYQK